MGSIIVGVVGPCGSGKTTLVEGLKTLGFAAKQIAQEHSFVPDMWKRITNPDILIYLDASYESTIIRKNLNWMRKEYEEELYRLKHAREYSDIYISTDALSAEQVLENVIGELSQRNKVPRN